MVIEGADYFVYRIPFANRANPAMTVVNDDGTFDIYLNTLFDDARLAAAMRLLQQESQTRQVLLFTCQGREQATLDAM